MDPLEGDKLIRITSKYGIAVVSFALAATISGAMAQNERSEDSQPSEIFHRHKSNPHEAGAPPAGSTGTQQPPIKYHGGPVMGTPTVYLIWYGNWNQNNGSDTAAGQGIIRDFLHGLNNSPYYRTNASYGSPSGGFSMSAEYTDAYSLGSRLSDSRVRSVVSNALSRGNLPVDSNGIYFVLTSSDVSESSGFCSQYCGWHTAGTIAGTNVKYAFVGNANRCLSACAAQTTGPNGNAGVDGMVSVLAHELEEANTDPDPISGWADSNGAENGDKCAWTFGQGISTAQNGASYNVSLPGISGTLRNYLIQRDLDANSVCYINYDTKAQ